MMASRQIAEGEELKHRKFEGLGLSATEGRREEEDEPILSFSWAA